MTKVRCIRDYEGTGPCGHRESFKAGEILFCSSDPCVVWIGHNEDCGCDVEKGEEFIRHFEFID